MDHPSRIDFRAPLSVSAADSTDEGAAPPNPGSRPARRAAERIAPEFHGDTPGNDFERGLNALRPKIHAQPVAPLLSATVRAFHGVAHRLGVGLGCGTSGAPPSWPMDGHLIERVLSILIADAIAESTTGGWIRVAAQADAQTLDLIVERSGIPRGPAVIASRPGALKSTSPGARSALPELDPMLSRFLVHLHGGTVTCSQPIAETQRNIVQLPHRAPEARPATTPPGRVSAQISDTLMRSLGLDRRRAGAPGAARSTVEAWNARLRRVIEDQLDDESFSVEQLATHMHCSRAQLFRRVKRCTGLAPQAYIAELRLHRAAQLLGDPGARVADIAAAVGFASLSHFSRSFRQRFGLAPSQFARAGSQTSQGEE